MDLKEFSAGLQERPWSPSADSVERSPGQIMFFFFFLSPLSGCLSGAAVRRRTRDRKVTGSTPGQGAIKSTRSTQPSIPLG